MLIGGCKNQGTGRLEKLKMVVALVKDTSLLLLYLRSQIVFPTISSFQDSTKRDWNKSRCLEKFSGTNKRVGADYSVLESSKYAIRNQYCYLSRYFYRLRWYFMVNS